MAKATNDKVKFLEEEAKEFVSLLGLSAQVKVVEEEESLNLLLSSDSPAVIIGHHGRNLAAFQTVLSSIVFKKFGEQTRVLVDVDGWREKREEKLKEYALQLADQVTETGTERSIFNLSPQERRVVHIALKETPGIQTESRGEGRERYLVVKPKS